MPELAGCLNVRARTKSDGVISYTNGITRSNSRADKRPTKKAAKVEAGVGLSPGVFLLPSLPR